MKRKAGVAIAVLAVVLAGCIRFAPPETLSISGATALADVTGDGTADVLVDNGSSLARLEYCGTGCLVAKQGFSGQRLRLVDDFSGDGIADVLTYDGTTYRVLFGGPTGLGSAVSVPTPDGVPGLSGDFNGDGKADIVVAKELFVYYGQYTVLLGDGAGHFTTSTMSALTGPFNAGRSQVEVADVTGDGRDDLVSSWLYNIQVTRYPDASPVIDSQIPADLFALGDIDGDGKADLARYRFGNPGPVDFFRSTGTGFTAFPAYHAITSGPQIRMGLRDIDADGAVDFLLDDGVNARTWWSGTNDGGFPYKAQSDVPLQASGCRNCFGDVNGDGRLDALSGNQLWINTSY